MDTDTHSIVSLSGVRKVFGENEVLKGIDLDIAEGEVVVIFGRSGSGKSTLLRCINFLEEPTAGSVEVDGVRYEAGPTSRARRKTIREIRSRTGMVFQEFNLFPHLSVIENVVEAPTTVKGMPKGEAEELGMRFLEQVGVTDKRDEYPIRLSGGQKQRVAIARPVHAPQGDALRRADLRARPRADRGGPRRDEGPSPGVGHDDGGGHPRDGLRPRGRRPDGLYARGEPYRGGSPRGD